MTISTANIFVSIVSIVILSGVLMGSTYGAGLHENDRESAGYKAAVSFAGISTGFIVVISLFVIYKAMVSKDKGISGGGSFGFGGTADSFKSARGTL